MHTETNELETLGIRTFPTITIEAVAKKQSIATHYCNSFSDSLMADLKLSCDN